MLQPAPCVPQASCPRCMQPRPPSRAAPRRPLPQHQALHAHRAQGSRRHAQPAVGPHRRRAGHACRADALTCRLRHRAARGRPAPGLPAAQVAQRVQGGVPGRQLQSRGAQASGGGRLAGGAATLERVPLSSWRGLHTPAACTELPTPPLIRFALLPACRVSRCSSTWCDTAARPACGRRSRAPPPPASTGWPPAFSTSPPRAATWASTCGTG